MPPCSRQVDQHLHPGVTTIGTGIERGLELRFTYLLSTITPARMCRDRRGLLCVAIGITYLNPCRRTALWRLKPIGPPAIDTLVMMRA